MIAQTAPRIDWVDFAKGVAIILVVLGHLKGEDLQKFIFVFHMPFFFVTAGFLLNLDKWGGYKKYNAFASKLFKRLIVPYCLAELLWYPIWFIICYKAGYLKYLWDWDKIEPIKAFYVIFINNGEEKDLILGQLWFLPVLFFAEIIFLILYNRFNKIGMEIFTLVVVFCSYVGFSIKNFLVLPLGIDTALTAQIFLLMGILIRKNNFVDRLSFINCCVLVFVVVVAFNFNSFVDMHSRRYGNELLFYAGGLAGTLLVMKLSMLLTKIGGAVCSFMNYCGQQSMMILVLHPIIANILYEIIAHATNIPPEFFFKEPPIIFALTVTCLLIPLFIAKRFGKLPVLRIFCT